MPTALITIGQGIGDLVMATPAIRALIELGYETSAFVRCNSEAAQRLLVGLPGLRRVSADEPTETFDVLSRTLWGPRYVKARRVVGPVELNKGIEATMLRLRSVHEAEFNMDGPRMLGWSKPSPLPMIRFDEYHHPLPLRYIAVSHGWGGAAWTEWTRKGWPHWTTFAEQSPLPLVVLGDGRLDFPSTAPNVMNLSGKTTLREAAGILKRAEHCVAIDSGLAHMSAALGTRTVVLFGATNETKSRPIGPHVSVLKSNIECRPCQHTPQWAKCQDWSCMAQITVSEVLTKLKEDW